MFRPAAHDGQVRPNSLSITKNLAWSLDLWHQREVIHGLCRMWRRRSWTSNSRARALHFGCKGVPPRPRIPRDLTAFTAQTTQIKLQWLHRLDTALDARGSDHRSDRGTRRARRPGPTVGPEGWTVGKTCRRTPTSVTSGSCRAPKRPAGKGDQQRA